VKSTKQRLKNWKGCLGGVHLLVSVDPQVGIHRLMKLVKGRSSRLLRQESAVVKRKWPTLWTNS
jgi:putative transposase